jgi:hypothetical protein
MIFLLDPHRDVVVGLGEALGLSRGELEEMVGLFDKS